jgi:hypothetical protein
MPYFPKSRIIENQKANPGEFTLTNGKEYTGLYYTTFDGRSFTGANPYSLNSIPLTKNDKPQVNSQFLLSISQ